MTSSYVAVKKIKFITYFEYHYYKRNNAYFQNQCSVVSVSLYEHGVGKSSCNSQTNDDRRIIFVATYF